MGVPNDQIEIAAMLRRIENLERRAPQFVTPEPELGCCTLYCCDYSLGETVNTGEIKTFCEFTPDPVGGAGMRLNIYGWVRLFCLATGSFGAVAFTTVDATTYDSAPRWDLFSAIHDGDRLTFPIGNTIDVTTPDPVIALRVQNLNTISFRIEEAHAVLEVRSKDGSSSCGHVHAGTGPV